MVIGYHEGSPPVSGFEPLRGRFRHSRILVVLAMAAIPAALGILQQMSFGMMARPAAIGGENAAAAAYPSGNQAPNPALADSANVRSSAKGGLLALCSGTPGAIVNAQLNCTPLDATIQR
jgi:hypothetical protein